jgi:hypothetical protein
MGAGAGQTGGGMQTMPQMGQMPSGAPSQMGLGALAAQRQQGGQADPRLMAMMQAFQNQGGAPGGPKMGTFGPNDMPVQYDPRKPDSMIPGGVPVQRPMPGMSAPGGVRFMDNLQAPVAPGDVLVQRPLPVGAGGKGTGMPPPGMVNPPRPMPLPPGLNRPMPMPMPPGNMVNPSRPMVQNNPRAQAAQSANPRLAQMMRGGSR